VIAILFHPLLVHLFKETVFLPAFRFRPLVEVKERLVTLHLGSTEGEAEPNGFSLDRELNSVS
jgi:hypothetical protein